MNMALAANLNVMMGIGGGNPALPAGLPALTAANCANPTSTACWYAYANWGANLAEIANFVTLFKGYSNLLFYMVGNEISLGVTSATPGWQEMWQFVGAAIALIKSLDPLHPVGTATPDIDQDVIFALNTICPSANPLGYAAAAPDLLGSNVYGNAGLVYPAALQACALSPPGAGCTLAAANSQYAWQKPYVMSELGPNNWFQVAALVPPGQRAPLFWRHPLLPPPLCAIPGR